MRVQSFTKAELGAFWNFWYFPHLFFGSPFPSLGHLPSRSAYILSRAHVQGNLCLCLCFLFGSYTCFAQICGLPRRAGLMSDQDFFEQIGQFFNDSGFFLVSKWPQAQMKTHMVQKVQTMTLCLKNLWPSPKDLSKGNRFLAGAKARFLLAIVALPNPGSIQGANGFFLNFVCETLHLWLSIRHSYSKYN